MPIPAFVIGAALVGGIWVASKKQPSAAPPAAPVMPQTAATPNAADAVPADASTAASGTGQSTDTGQEVVIDPAPTGGVSGANASPTSAPSFAGGPGATIGPNGGTTTPAPTLTVAHVDDVLAAAIGKNADKATSSSGYQQMQQSGQLIL